MTTPPPSGTTVRQAPIPSSHAILWVPQGGTAGTPPQFPVFIAQSALRAINEHFRASPDSGLLGFLTGDLCEDAASHARYVIVDSTVRLTQPIYGDKTTVVVSRVMERVHKELAKTNGHVIGWYHSHPPLGLSLAAGDLETHVTYFGKAWHVALVLGGTAEQPTAALFRVPKDEPAGIVALPFYELIDEREAKTPGGKVSHSPWRNFRTADRAVTRGMTAAVPAQRVSQKGAAPAARSTLEVMRPADSAPAPTAAPQPAAPPAPPPPPAAPKATPKPAPAPARPAPTPSTVGLPMLDVQAPSGTPPPPPAHPPAPAQHTPAAPRAAPPPVARPPEPRRRTSRPVVHASLESARKTRGGPGWGTLLVVLVLLGAAGGAYYYFKLRPQSAGPAPAAGAAAVVPADTALRHFESIADSAMRVVRNYGDRARLFATRQITCAELTRGFAAVEDQMIAYGAARKALTQPLDAAHAARDQALFAAVDTVDAQFDRSRCPRP